MTPMKLSALDTIDNSYSCGGSQKKIKLRHTEKDYAAAFDLGVINAVLDLECDLDSEYYDDHHGKDENINSANIMTSSYDFKENKRSDLVRNKCEKAVDKSSILKSSVTKNNTKIERDYDDDYNNYVASVRKYINYLNTMEDDEEQTYAVRAKLFEFVRGYDYNFNVLSSHLFPSNQVNGPARWTLRGVGPVRFLRHLEEGITYGTVRMTMYHEGTLQTLMDHLVEPGLEVTSTKDKKGRRQYMWTTEDTALGSTQRTFALRFSSERDALSWKDHFEKSKKATGDARLAIDRSCYAPPASPCIDRGREESLKEPVTCKKSEISVTTVHHTPFDLQKKRRVSI